MVNISFKTLEVWNIERAGNTKSIELIAIFNVEDIENRLKYSLFDSQHNLISSLSYPRKYTKGEAVYPKFFETNTPDGIVTMTAYLLDENNKQISNIAAKTLYLKKAQPASGIGQKALEDPAFTLPEFPEATTEATTTAQSAKLVAEKVQQDIEEVYVSSQEARKEITEEVSIEAPEGITLDSIVSGITQAGTVQEAAAQEEIIDHKPLNTSTSLTMISQKWNYFDIVDGRAKGQITFRATSDFNPYYYGKELVNYMQLVNNQGLTIVLKPNVLRFTQTEQDETIQYDEGVGDLKSVKVESYVWTHDNQPMSSLYKFPIYDGKPPGTGTGELARTDFLAKIGGVLAGSIAIALLLPKRIGK